MMSLITWELINVTKLILLYMMKLSGSNTPLTATSIQLSRNVESRLHVDRNNQGNSFITGWELTRGARPSLQMQIRKQLDDGK